MMPRPLIILTALLTLLGLVLLASPCGATPYNA